MRLAPRIALAIGFFLGLAGAVWADGRGFPRGGGAASRTTVTTGTVNATSGNFTHVNAGTADAGTVRVNDAVNFYNNSYLNYVGTEADKYLAIACNNQFVRIGAQCGGGSAGALDFYAVAGTKQWSIHGTTGDLFAQAANDLGLQAGNFVYLNYPTNTVGVRSASGIVELAPHGVVTGDFRVGSGGSGDLLINRDVYTVNGGQLFYSETAPTVAAACTSPTVTWSNGSSAFQIDVGGTCTGISTLSITMPASANGWSCSCDSVSAAATRVVAGTSWSTTNVTVTNFSRTLGTAADWADGADVRCGCHPG